VMFDLNVGLIHNGTMNNKVYRLLHLILLFVHFVLMHAVQTNVVLSFIVNVDFIVSYSRSK